MCNGHLRGSAILRCEDLIEDDKKEAMEMILSTKGIGVIGSLRGYIFENLAHDIIVAGGTFKVRDFETDDTIDELQPGHFNVPLSQIFQSVDALIPPDSLFQMTVSGHRTRRTVTDIVTDITDVTEGVTERGKGRRARTGLTHA
ncbi:hypothetical protein BGX38DRAFT_1141633 [Terfezia claveryi]|nr:hypothetical protein BGX38DRAFT_1141633 [Terfezia claveryi]